MAGALVALGGALWTGGGLTALGGAVASTTISLGISAYQKNRQKKAALNVARQAKKAQAKALRRLQQQQQKIKAANFEVPFLSQADNTLMIRNPIASRRMVYGRTRIGGVWVFYEKTGASGEYRHLILALSEGPCEEIEGIYFDDTLVTLGADGNATGTYAGYARVMKHLGDAVASEITGTFTWASGATLDCVAHGLSDGDHVRLATYAGTGLATATSYIVLNKTDDTFQLALYATPTTPITASAGGTFQRYIADGYAVSECANWTETHRLNGICYIYVRLKNNLDLFPNVIPQISVVMKGKADIEDPRTGTAAYSTNSALCLSHYLQEPILGPGIDTYDIHPDELINAANTCDENVLTATSANFTSTFASDLITSAGHGLSDGDILFLTGSDLPDPLAVDTAYYVISATADTFKLSESSGGSAVTLTDDGTPTHAWRLSEKRYSTNGVLQLANDVEDNRNALASPMGGAAVYTNGYWVISAAEYFTPTFLIDEDMIVGEIELRNEIPRRDRFNLIKGTYVAEENNWQPFGFPSVTNAQYLADDGGKTIMQEVQFPFTTSPATAQRIAKLTLERNRRGVSLQLNCSLRAFPVQAGKTCLVSISRYGFVRKPFEVTSTSFAIEDGKPTIEVSLRETDADIYNWDYSEEVPVNIPADLIKPGTKVADITVDPVAGTTYVFPLSITLATATAGAAIRYSLTETPSTIGSGIAYTGAFNIADGDTVYARAFLNGYRSSDAFEETWSGITALSDISGLVHDWNADLGVTEAAGVVSAWASQAGSNIVMSASGSKQPTINLTAIGGKAAIIFDGTDDVLTSTAEAFAQPNTIFLVVQPSNVTAAAYQVITNGTSGNRHTLRKKNGTTGIIQMYAGGSIPDSSTAMVDGTTYVMAARYNGASSDLRFDGVQVSAANVGTEGLSIIYLGGSDATPTYPFPGKIARYVAYDSALSDDDCVLVEAYLTDYYGL